MFKIKFLKVFGKKHFLKLNFKKAQKQNSKIKKKIDFFLEFFLNRIFNSHSNIIYSKGAIIFYPLNKIYFVPFYCEYQVLYPLYM